MKYFFKIDKILFLVVLISVCFSCTLFDKSVDVDRTVLIYMAANNNLSGSAVANLKELKEGYVPDYIESEKSGAVLLVYYHLAGKIPLLLRISKDRHGKVNQEIIQEYDKEQNSGDISTLKMVLEYTSRLFPSEDNGLFLWSHGTGWLPSDFYSNPVKSFIGEDGQLRQMSVPAVVDPMRHLVKSFGNDYGEDIEMDIRELADALPIKYSYIVFDACLMGGVEVAYELKDKADYVISSTAEILVSGFPYDKIMTHIFENQESNLPKVCEEYFDFYNSSSSETSKSATISLVRTSNLRALADASAVIFNKDRENIETLNVNEIQRYFRFEKSWFYDLDDYMKNISSDLNDYNRFSVAMENTVIYKNATSNFFFNGTYFEGDGFAIECHSGLSTYIPKEKNAYLEEYYKALSWNIDTQMIK